MKYWLKIYLKLLLVLCLCSQVYESKALHIIGGDVVYKCLSIDTILKKVTYEITFTMYRDSKSNGANFDDPTDFGIYRGSGNNWRFVNRITQVRVTNITDIDISNSNPCILIPVNVGVQSGVYKFVVTLDIIDETYMIAYQRCCRNNTILNLSDPGNTGAAFNTEISPEAQKSCNNSPTFKNFPPVVICVNRPIKFDHSAIDIDGDSLVYEFCNPLTAGGTDGATTPGSATSCTGVIPSPNNCLPPFDLVTFRSPNFTFDKPMGGNPVVFIDNFTGIIDGSPNVLGQYVVGVCVKEYRKGVLIGVLRRDFQFNVTTCENAVVADIKATSKTDTEFNINSCGEFTINFRNLSTDVRYIENYFWEFDINGNKQTYSSRDVQITFPGLGTYSAIMILNKDIAGLAECSDTANITINLYPSIDASYTFDYDTCTSGPITFKDLSVSGAGPVLKWDWNFIEGKSSVKDPLFEFETPGTKPVSLIVEDVNKCRDTLVQDIDYFPVPSLIVVEPNNFIGCQPANIFFQNLSKPIDETYQIEWDFGDGGTSNEISPNHIYENTGVYNIGLKIVSPIGCETVKSYNGFIKVVESPQAGFTFTPEKPTFSDNTVQFIDQSVDAFGYLWKFDSLGISLLREPSFTFTDTGVFMVQQIVLHESGCSDTANAIINIFPIVDFFMPNAFTPNNDGLNDEFVPVGRFFGIRAYQFSVWNRWGDKIFESNDFIKGWNGQRNNSGENSPPGVYAYLVEYVDAFREKKILKGHCTLIR